MRSRTWYESGKVGNLTGDPGGMVGVSVLVVSDWSGEVWMSADVPSGEAEAVGFWLATDDSGRCRLGRILALSDLTGPGTVAGPGVEDVTDFDVLASWLSLVFLVLWVWASGGRADVWRLAAGGGVSDVVT